MLDLKGSIVALITPFKEDGSVNYAKLEELLEWHIASETDAILLLGTTGESPTMTHEEDAEIIRFGVKTVNGRVPLIASSGSNCTRTMIEASKRFEDTGIDALLCITPYYNKGNKMGIYHHFADVADAIKIPMIMYNVPGRTSCSIAVDVVKELSQHENIMGIKEASGDLSYVTEISRYASDNFRIYSGNDDTILPLMALGGSGVISVWANLMPNIVHEMVTYCLNNEYDKARAIQLKYIQLIKDLFIEVNPIPIKEAMNMAGMGVGGYRLPLYPMTDADREILRAEMKRMELIK